MSILCMLNLYWNILSGNFKDIYFSKEKKILNNSNSYLVNHSMKDNLQSRDYKFYQKYWQNIVMGTFLRRHYWNSLLKFYRYFENNLFQSILISSCIHHPYKIHYDYTNFSRWIVFFRKPMWRLDKSKSQRHHNKSFTFHQGNMLYCEN